MASDFENFIIIAIVTLLVAMPVIGVIHRIYYRYVSNPDRSRRQNKKTYYPCNDCNRVFATMTEVTQHEDQTAHRVSRIATDLPFYDADNAQELSLIMKIMISLGFVKVKKNG